jgi:hypothetical protein
VSKLDKHMPGWVSHGPVQINVGRDLHIHGGCGPAFEPDAMPRRELAPSLAFNISRVFWVVWSLVEVGVRLVGALLQLAAWVTFTLLALGVWSLGRVGDLLRAAEHVCGGAPTKLVYVPSFMPRAEAPMHMLGAGDNVRELEALARENDYDLSN